MTSTAYNKIVVAVDGSSTSDLALSEAIRVAAPGGATVLALYVVDTGTPMFDAGYYDPSQLQKAFVESGQRALQAASQRLAAAASRMKPGMVTEAPVPGDMGASINEAARSGAPTCW